MNSCDRKILISANQQNKNQIEFQDYKVHALTCIQYTYKLIAFFISVSKF